MPVKAFAFVSYANGQIVIGGAYFNRGGFHPGMLYDIE
jgi:hypothetical protein